VPVVAANESAWSEFSPPAESPTPAYARPPWREPNLTSPDGTYTIECDKGLRLYRTVNHELLSESPLQALSFSTWSPCSHYVTWAPDASAAAIQVQEDAGQRRALYIWRVDGSAPRKIVDTSNGGVVGWSPDSQRLAVMRYLADGSRTEIVTVVDL
jgi:dipeptidyl aminopeptidase/acylaminoacyl peptidase